MGHGMIASHLRRRAARQQIAEHERLNIAAVECDNLPLVRDVHNSTVGGGTRRLLERARAVVNSGRCIMRPESWAVCGSVARAAIGDSLPAGRVSKKRQPPTLHQSLPSHVDTSGAAGRKGVRVDLEHRHASTEAAAMELTGAYDRRAREPRATEVGARRYK